jgi:hypothetical protein
MRLFIDQKYKQKMILQIKKIKFKNKFKCFPIISKNIFMSIFTSFYLYQM